MARHLPSPAVLDGLSFKELAAYIDQTPAGSKTPAELLALTEQHDKAAIAAETHGSKKGILAAYLSFCNAFVTMRTSPRFTEAKRDPAFRSRADKLKPLYDSRRVTAGQLKAALFPPEAGTSHATRTITPASAPAPTHRSSPSVDSEAGGSIAERLKALRGSGMEAATSSSKRLSREIPRPPGRPFTDAAWPAANSTSISPSSPPTSILGPHSAARGTMPTSLPPGGHQRGGSASSIPRVLSTQSVSSLVNGNTGESALEQNGRGSTSGSPSNGTSALPGSTPPGHGPLPTLLQDAPRSSSSNSGGDDLDKFEKAFPSLDNFGKQFDTDGFVVPPVPTSGGRRSPLPEPPKEPPAEDADLDSLFPSLPSVPTDLPGQRRPSISDHPSLPPPPPRIDASDLIAPSPPSPDLLGDLKRPASTPVTRDHLANSISMSPPEGSQFDLLGPDNSSAKPEPPTMSPDLWPKEVPSSLPPSGQPPSGPPPSQREGPSNPRGSSPIPPFEAPEHVDFPVAAPAAPSAPIAIAAPAPSGGMPVKAKRPDFPFTNTIMPETLRSYFLNLSVDVLLLDVRPESEFQNGYVGYQYVERGCKINVVWIDPTILMRPGLTSSGLEDALSVSPEAQRLAFENRNRYDLCVIYDTRSMRMPKKGEQPTPAGRLFDIINENEFVKPLPRFPTLLIGGYEGWVSFVLQRQRQGMAEHKRMLQQQQQQQQQRQAMSNGHAPNASMSNPTYGQPPKLDRQSHGYTQSVSNPYSKDITQNFNTAIPQSMSGQSFHSSSPSFSGMSYSGSNYYSSPAPYTQSPPPRASISAAASPPVPPPPGHHRSSQSISSYSSVQPPIAPLPRASIHPGAGTRRQSSYDNQQYTGAFNAPHRPSIDYPQAHALAHVPQPPPVAASHSLERVDARPHPTHARTSSLRPQDQFVPSNGVRYWANAKLGITGLKNLGNTCYMNSTIQCLSATFPFARFFLDGRYKREINIYNNLGTRGDLANAFATLLSGIWGETYNFLSPQSFRASIVKFKSDFGGTEQHDSQEFLSFVMDGLHEDLNRIKVRPKAVEMTPEREAALETLPPQIASDKEWQIYKMRNDSFIVDLFQGQYMNRMECLTCHKTSTVYDSFQWLTLDLPATGPVRLTELLDRWVRPEIMDGDDKWNCPRCKVPRRASKTLTLVRLPPVLLIQLKRFLPVQGGRFYNKSETSVNFPLEGLDLTRFVPPRQPTGTEDMDDPRTQIGPFKYDLYGVSNHMGTLSSGHYTAYVRSGDQWMFCDDSRFTPARREDVMSRPGYILFYKRVL